MKYKVSIINKNTNKVITTSSVLNATPNANGNTGANLSSAKLYEQEFSISEAGNYVIRFQNNASGFDEFLLLECRINSKPSAIEDVLSTPSSVKAIYDVNGIRRESLQRGLNIIHTEDGKVRKFFMK